MSKFEKAHGVYVHVPFCKRKCLYCDFPSQACADDGLLLRYAKAVCNEIAKRKVDVADNATVYFGGGTPSLMSLSGIADMVAALKEYGCWRNPTEATIECNPGTVDKEKLQGYRELGFDRISFGVQSFNDDELKTIGRIHNAEQALKAVQMAKDVGFKRINADLMYGLSGQTLRSLEQSLAQMVALNLEHISVYSLILEEGTPLEKLVRNNELTLPDDDLVADMDELVSGYLCQQGYEQYEISNFAKPGAYSQHNLVYWSYLPYVGFGAASTGFDGYCRRTGVPDVEEYLANPLAAMVEQLTPDNLYGEFMFMNLRKKWGANLQDFADRYGEDIKQKTLMKMKKCLRDGLVVYNEEGNRLRLTAKGRNLGNLVFQEFV